RIGPTSRPLASPSCFQGELMRPCSLRLLAVSGLSLLLTASAHAQPKVVALSAEPPQVTLTHADDQQRLLVTGRCADDSLRDLTRSVRYTSSNPAVAAVSPQGVVTPKTAGTAVIQVAGPGVNIDVPVAVKEVVRRPVSFTNDVMPILAKAGCNSGACHGSASGKQGFQITLRGSAPVKDYPTLTRG